LGLAVGVLLSAGLRRRRLVEDTTPPPPRNSMVPWAEEEEERRKEKGWEKNGSFFLTQFNQRFLSVDELGYHPSSKPLTLY